MENSACGIDLEDGGSKLLDIGFFIIFFAAIGSRGAVLLVSFQALGLFLYWRASRCAKSKAKSILVGWGLWGLGGVVRGGH